MERDRIAEFVSQRNVALTRLSAAERDDVVRSLKNRLAVNVEVLRPWDTVDAPSGVQTVSAWELVPKYVGTAPCLVFSPGATSVWKFANGADLLLFLKASPPFEFYVCDATTTYLLCCNDHDFIIGWGRSNAWVERFRTI